MFILPKTPHLLPTSYEIKGLVGSQNGAYIHSSVSTSPYYLPTNLYKSVVDFTYFRWLVKSPLELEKAIASRFFFHSPGAGS